MKTLCVIFIGLISISRFAFCQTVTVDGYAYLESQTNHSNIQVILQQIAPSTSSDTIYTSSLGYYNINISSGVYNISYIKNGYITISIQKSLYANTNLTSTTLQLAGLTGHLSGVLHSGTYKVSDNIDVLAGDTLIIQSGANILFMQDKVFTINGFIIANGTITDSIRFSTYNGATSWNGIDFNPTANNNSVLSYCVIDRSNSSGIFVNGCSPSLKNLNIRNNLNGSTGPGLANVYGGGILFYNSNSKLINSIISGNNLSYGSGGGIYSYHGSVKVYNCLFRNNNFGAVSFYETNNFVLANSTIVNNSSGGVAVFWNNSIGSIYNSIFANNTGNGVSLSPNNTSVVYNCNSWNNGTNYSGGTWLGTNVTINNRGDSCDAYGNIKINPLFVNSTYDNFNLSSSSPCINAGKQDTTGLNIPTTDLAGNPRIIENHIDMGAYEYPYSLGVSTNTFLLNNITVFPNPCNEYLYINSNIENIDLKLINIVGQVLFSVSNVSSFDYTLDMRNYNKGLYQLIVSKGEFIFSKKIVIQ